MSQLIKEDDQDDIYVIKEVEEAEMELEERKKVYFYRSPKLRQFWGEDQHHFESWKELFFDLIFVAIAFNAGKTLEETIVEDEGFGSVIYFFAQFFPMYASWFMRTIYIARFEANSYFHALLDIFYALLLSLMASFISTRTEIELAIADDRGNEDFLGFNSALGFSCCGLGLGILNLFICLEMYFEVPKRGLKADLNKEMRERQKRAVKATARISLMRGLIFVIFVIISIIGVFVKNEGLFIFGLLAAFFVALAFHLLIKLVFSKCFTSLKSEMVPINLHFLLRRFGEFGMLMLGEGILQIIIKAVNADDLDGHILTFCFAFLVSSSLFALIYYALPFEPKEHSYRKSSLAGLLTTFVLPLRFGALIAVGVCLKLILQEEEDLDFNAGVIRRAYSVFMFFTYFFVLLERNINFGYHEIIRKDYTKDGIKDKSWENFNFKRTFMTIIIFFTPLTFVLLRMGVDLDGPEFLAVSLLIGFIIFGLLLYETKLIEKQKDIVEIPENYPLILSDEIREKYISMEVNESTKSVARPETQLASGRKKNCHVDVKQMLRYLRKTTEKLDVKANLMQEEHEHQGSVSFVGEDTDWNEELNTIEKIVRIIRSSHGGNAGAGGMYAFGGSSKKKAGSKYNLEEVEIKKDPPAI